LSAGAFEADLRARGLVYQVTDEALFASLAEAPTTLYIGFDPTASSLHVGNLLQLCTLRRFQLAGHRPIALAGGGTGMIGDPGGRDEERQLLDDDQLAENLAGITAQLERFLDFSPSAGAAQAMLLDNGAWLRQLELVEFLRDFGKHFTVNEMVAKESVKARLERPEHGISFTEFSYMLLQAYDFLQLYRDHGCTLQVGGSDQWGNITLGVAAIRKLAGGHGAGLTQPLVTKADGTKFGKSVGGAVWLDRNRTSAYQLFQFFMGAEDEVVGRYLRYFTFLSLDELDHLDAETAAQPQARAAQRQLASSVVTLVHGAGDAALAAEASSALFSGTLASLEPATFEAVAAEVPTSVVDRDRLLGGIALVDLVSEVGLCASKGEARRALEQGGVYVNDQRADVETEVGEAALLHGRFVALRRGRRQYHLVEAR